MRNKELGTYSEMIQSACELNGKSNITNDNLQSNLIYTTLKICGVIKYRD